MNRYFLSVVCLILGIGLSGCLGALGNGQNENELPLPKYRLRYHLAKGRKFIVKASISSETLSKPRKTASSVDYQDEVVFLVKSVDTKGNALIETWTEKNRVRFKTGDQISEFDSSVNYDKISPFLIEFPATLNVPIQFELSPQGEIIQIMDTDAAVGKVLQKADALSGGDEYDIDYLKALYSAEFWEDNLIFAIPPLPGKSISVGESWTYERHSKVNPPTLIKSECTLAEATKSEFRVKCTDKIRLEPGRPVKSIVKIDFREYKATRQSHYGFDRKTGWLIRADRELITHESKQVGGRLIVNDRDAISTQTWINFE